MATFDSETLGELRKAQEVKIRTQRHPATAVVIWIVVADGEVFVRSFRAAKGRWYRDLSNGGPATLEFRGRRLTVQAVPANEPAAIERVSGEFLRKYKSSSYAKAMVEPANLPTTLRLEPR